MTIKQRFKLLERLIIALMVSVGLGYFPVVAAPTAEIQSLTVAFLFNFLKLTEWPENALADKLTLCAVQNNDFTINLADLADKEVQNYKLTIRRLVPGDSIENCHLIYIPEGEKPIRIQEWLKNVANFPILSVSSSKGFLEAGGMIELVSDGSHLQFTVNLEPVEKVGIKLSSKMLQIAREVRGNH